MRSLTEFKESKGFMTTHGGILVLMGSQHAGCGLEVGGDRLCGEHCAGEEAFTYRSFAV